MKEFGLVFRNWLRRPLMQLTVLATIALGLGATVLVFSAVYGVLLEPFEFPHADRLVRLYASNPSQGYDRAGMAVGDTVDLAERSRSLEMVSIFLPRTVALSGQGRPEMVRTAAVSPTLFPLLGFEAAAGRVFGSAEALFGAPPVAVVSSGFAARRFGSPAGALGRSLRLDGQEHQVVGVLETDAQLGSRDVDVWHPFSFDPSNLDRRSHYLPVFARRAPGASLEASRHELVDLAARLEAENPESNEGWTVYVSDYRESVVGPIRPVLWTLFAAVLFVLLICCANLANLLLARAATRGAEAAIRTALGASPRRLVRLFLLEGLASVAVGGVLGILLAWSGLRLLSSRYSDLLPRTAEIDLDLPVIGFSILLIAVTTLLVGLLPAWRFARQDPARRLRAGGPGQSTSRESVRFRGALVVVQTGLAFVLLVSAGLTLKGLVRLQDVDPGFEPERAAAIQVFLSPDRYPGDAESVRFFETLLERLGADPETSSIGAGSAVPLHRSGQNALPFESREAPPAGDETYFASFTAVTPEYFRTLGIPILAGRAIEPGDRQDSRPVALVNRALAERTWPQEQPLGKHVSLTIRGDEPTELEVVGVVGDVRMTDLREEPEPAVYVPFRQFPHTGMVVVLRSPRPEQVLRRAEEQVFELDPEQPVFEAFQLDTMVREARKTDRLFVSLFALFGAFSLILVGVGVFGIAAYNAQQRDREMGIRLALGARRGQIVRELLRANLLQAGLGIALGVIAALWSSRFLGALLYQVEPSDPAVYAIGLGCLALAVLIAAGSASVRVLGRDSARCLRQG